MRHFIILIFILPFKISRNQFRSIGWEDCFKHTVLIGFALGVGWVEYILFAKLWSIVGSLPMGFMLVLPRFFSWVGSFLFAFLAYSSFLTALSSLYTSDDLEFLVASPVSTSLVLLTKWINVAVHSGTTLVLLSLPPVIALIQSLDVSIVFLAAYFASTIAFAGIAVSLGVWIAMLLAAVFPLKRMHQTAAILGLCMAAMLITGLRFLNIETLWSENADSNPLLVYLQADQSSVVKYGPGRLFAESVMPFLSNSSSLGFWIILVTSLIFLLSTIIVGKKFFLRGWRRSIEQSDPLVNASVAMSSSNLSSNPTNSFGSLLWKDWLMFKRDPTIWTQLFMMVPLATLYLLNLSFLPMNTKELMPFYAAADVGLIALIISAIGARFLFPSASREGKAVWIPVASPVKAREIILQKVLLLVTPVLLLAGCLFFGSALVLKMPLEWMAWCMSYGMIMSLLICLLAVFLGFCLPMYSYRHLLEVSLGKGAFLFMVISLLQISGFTYCAIRSIMIDPTQIPFMDLGLLGCIIAWIIITIACYYFAKRKWGLSIYG